MRRSKIITPLLSLVLPVYNESRRIQIGLKTAISYLEKQSYSWEIIVVDDGSTDSTAKIAAQFKSRINLIKSARNFGKGHAIRMGITAALGDYIIFSDIDFSVPPKFIKNLLKALRKSDLAIGSRRLPQSNIAQHQDIIRESLGRGFTALSNFILGLNHTDLTCGFKGFTNSVAKKLFQLQRLNRWAFDAEVLFLAKKLHYQVTEIPIIWKNDPRTKVNLILDLPLSLLSLFYIRLLH